MKFENEEWRDVEDYPARYLVSNMGRVASLRDNRGCLREHPRILKPVMIGHKPNNLYLAVNLYQDKRAKQHSVHRLVAKAFLENSEGLPMVNHKDEDTFNNCVANLEWCTSQYNQEYSLSKKKYEFINSVGEPISIVNLRKFSRESGLNHAHMYQVHQGNLPSHKGWIRNTNNTTIFTEM